MSRARNLIGSMPENAAAVTKHDTDLLSADSVVYVGTGGDIAAYTIHGDLVTFKNLADGDLLPVKVRRIMSTNTTASDMVALW